MEIEYNKIFKEIEDLFSFVGTYINEMINVDMDKLEEQNLPIDTKKPPLAKTVDKGAKKG